MKLTFTDIKQRLQQKPVIVKPKTHKFSHFVSKEIDLDPFRLDEDLWVVTDYIGKDLEDLILDFGVYANPFVVLRDRRVQVYGGQVTPEGLVDRTQLPDWADIFSQRLFDEKIFPLKPNHVLVNEYKIGEGIMPHTDGPAYFPLVSILSLGSDSVMEFSKDNKVLNSVYLPQRSLLLFTGNYYTDLQHAIDRVTSDQIVFDDCGQFLLKNNEVFPIKGKVPLALSNEEFPEVLCPVCSQRFTKLFTSYRETRISLTIRYVPIKY